MDHDEHQAALACKDRLIDHITAERDALRNALRDLDDCNWLDDDWSNTDELAAAKRRARALLKGHA